MKKERVGEEEEEMSCCLKAFVPEIDDEEERLANKWKGELKYMLFNWLSAVQQILRWRCI